MVNGIAIADIQSGSLYQYGYMERFKRTDCPTVLNLYLLKQIRSVIEEWLMVYNTGRLHEALNNMTLNISHPETRSVIFCVNYVLRMA